MDGPEVVDATCRSYKDQIAVCKWILNLKLSDDPIEALTELKNNTVRFPLTRPSAWFLAKLWKQTADQLADLEQSKRIEVFSASFWFLDQIGQHGDLKEPGICLTFSFLYQSFLDDKSMKSLAREMLRRLINISLFPSWTLLIIRELASCISNKEEDKSIAEDIFNKLVSKFLWDCTSAPILLYLLSLRTEIHNSVRKKSIYSLMEMPFLELLQVKLLGKLMVVAVSEKDLMIQIRKLNEKYPQSWERIKSAIIQNIWDDSRQALLQAIVAYSNSNAYKSDLLPSQIEDLIIAVCGSGKVKVFDITFPSHFDTFIYWRAVAKSGLVVHAPPELFCQVFVTNFSSWNNIAQIFYNSLKRHDQKTLIEIACYLFAYLKTCHTVVFGSNQCLNITADTSSKEVQAPLLLIIDLLKFFVQVDPVWYPFDLLKQLHDWSIRYYAYSSSYSTLLYQIYRLSPNLFNPESYPGTADSTDLLYSLFKSSIPPNDTSQIGLVDDDIDCPSKADKRAYLYTKLDSLSFEKVSKLIVQRLGFEEDISSEVLEYYRKILKLTQISTADIRCHISKLSILSRTAPNYESLLNILNIFLESLKVSDFKESDNIFLFEIIQQILSPEYFKFSSDISCSILSKIFLISANSLKSEYCSSLVKHILDETIPTQSRMSYIQLLTVLSDDADTVLSILASLTKDNRRPALQNVSLSCLAKYVSSKFHLIQKSHFEALFEVIWCSACSNLAAQDSLFLAVMDSSGMLFIEEETLHSNLAEILLMFDLASLKCSFSLLKFSTRVLWLTKSFNYPHELSMLIRRHLRSFDSLTDAIETLKWFLEFSKENQIMQSVIDYLLVAVPQVPGSFNPIEEIISTLDVGFAKSICFIKSFQNISSVQVAERIHQLLKMIMKSSADEVLAVAAAECFRISLLMLSSGPEITQIGLDLLCDAMERFQNVPDLKSPECSLLELYQPQIITMFGLACNNTNPMVRSHGYCLLTDSFSKGFYGLGIMNHPRLERLLPGLSCMENDDYPPLLNRIATLKLFARISSHLSSPSLVSRIDIPSHWSKLCLESVKVFSHQLVQTGNLPLKTEVIGDTLLCSPDIIIGCVRYLLSLSKSEIDDDDVIAMALATKNLEMLNTVNLDHIPDQDILSLIRSTEPVSMDMIALLKEFDDFDLVLSRQLSSDELEIILDNGADMSSFCFCKLFYDLLQNCSDEKKLMNSLHKMIPTLPRQTFQDFCRFMLWIVDHDDSKSLLAAQLVSLALVVKSKTSEIPHPLIKSFAKIISTRFGEVGIDDCLLLIICKSKDHSLRKVLVALTKHVLLQIEGPKKKLLHETLRELGMK